MILSDMQVAEAIMSRFKRKYPDLWTEECNQELAHIYWSFGEHERAMFVMKDCLNSLKPKVCIGYHGNH